MVYFVLKTLITALVVAGVSELAKRYSFMAAALASLPLTSILAFIWIYIDTKDTQKITELSYSIFWLVIPSLIFFLIVPFLLKHGVNFYLTIILSCLVMSAGYGVFIFLKRTMV
jgi:uncharacterized membrane protein (GlpM family)